jgi:hypothetical protein
MQYPNDSRRCLTVLDQDSTLMAVIEMSLSSWSGLRVVLRSLPIYAQGVASRGPLYPVPEYDSMRCGQRT